MSEFSSAVNKVAVVLDLPANTRPLKRQSQHEAGVTHLAVVESEVTRDHKRSQDLHCRLEWNHQMKKTKDVSHFWGLY